MTPFQLSLKMKCHPKSGDKTGQGWSIKFMRSILWYVRNAKEKWGLSRSSRMSSSSEKYWNIWAYGKPGIMIRRHKTPRIFLRSPTMTTILRCPPPITGSNSFKKSWRPDGPPPSNFTEYPCFITVHQVLVLRFWWIFANPPHSFMVPTICCADVILTTYRNPNI